MKISEINTHIANGGKFFTKVDNKVKEVRFESLTMVPHPMCSVCSWGYNLAFKVAGDPITHTHYTIQSKRSWDGRNSKAVFYTDPMDCANDAESVTKLVFTKGDGSLVDDTYPLQILAENGWGYHQGYYTKFPIAYAWKDCKCVEVHLSCEVEVLSKEVKICSYGVYKTEKDCKENNAIQVEYFAD